MPAPFITSRALDAPNICHGFFGREGGRSTGDFASNNMSIALGDVQDLVISNRSSAAAQMGDFGMRDLVLFRQTHSTTVVTLTERHDVSVAVEADAMVTNRRDQLLGILTADCAPVLLADPDAGVVGAAHAGWKGAAGGILYATVMGMVALGADPAAVGLEGGQLILEDHLGVVEEAPDQGRLAVVDAAAGKEAQQRLVLVRVQVRFDVGRNEIRDVRHQKYPSCFFFSIEADWSWSITRPCRSEVVVSSISWMIAVSVSASLSIAPVSG